MKTPETTIYKVNSKVYYFKEFLKLKPCTYNNKKRFTTYTHFFLYWSYYYFTPYATYNNLST